MSMNIGSPMLPMYPRYQVAYPIYHIKQNIHRIPINGYAGMRGAMPMSPMNHMGPMAMSAMGGAGHHSMNPQTQIGFNGENSMLPSNGAVTKCQPLAHMKLCTTYDGTLN